MIELPRLTSPTAGVGSLRGMSGMGGSNATNDPVIVQAFHRALAHQGLLAVGLLLAILVAWNVLRAVQLRQRAADGATPSVGVQRNAEATARRILRIGFGLLWILDGVLQGQASMPNGLIPQVVQPAAQGSPGWVVRLVDDAAKVWTYHPVTAAAATVWIQLGIGVWLLVAPRGNWSRLAGVAGATWGALVWVFGEAFGSVFAPGLSWLEGAPGAALLYALAGVAIALPDDYWSGARMGRVICRLSGTAMMAFAVLQAWPGRGFWQGQPAAHDTPGSLVAMSQQMAQTPQPGLVHSLVNAFAGFTAQHGWAVNLFVVAAMLGVGIGLVVARPAVARWAVVGGGVLALATWVLVQDLGVFGGVGTDPNSMIPWLLFFVAGYWGLTRPADEAAAVEGITATITWRQHLTQPAYALRVVAAVAAVATTLIGAAPMAIAATEPNADPIIASETDGPVTATDIAAPNFHLVNQAGAPVDLAALAGKAVAVTFLDPVCTNDCPTIATEFRLADGLLGHYGHNVEMVAVDANPRYLAPVFLQAFDRQEGLDRLANWDYLTGSDGDVTNVYKQFGVEVSVESGGAMVDHSDIAFVIDPAGRIRYVLDADPGPADAVTESSFAVTLADYVEKALGPT